MGVFAAFGVWCVVMSGVTLLICLFTDNSRLSLAVRRRGTLNEERSDALLRIERAKMEAEVRRAIAEAEAPHAAGDESGRLSVVGGRA